MQPERPHAARPEMRRREAAPISYGLAGIPDQWRARHVSGHGERVPNLAAPEAVCMERGADHAIGIAQHITWLPASTIREIPGTWFRWNARKLTRCAFNASGVIAWHGSTRHFPRCTDIDLRCTIDLCIHQSMWYVSPASDVGRIGMSGNNRIGFVLNSVHHRNAMQTIVDLHQCRFSSHSYDDNRCRIHARWLR